jgi:hypothetical protein
MSTDIEPPPWTGPLSVSRGAIYNTSESAGSIDNNARPFAAFLRNGYTLSVRSRCGRSGCYRSGGRDHGLRSHQTLPMAICSDCRGNRVFVHLFDDPRRNCLGSGAVIHDRGQWNIDESTVPALDPEICTVVSNSPLRRFQGLFRQCDTFLHDRALPKGASFPPWRINSGRRL